MDVKLGYKLTEIGVIPEDWKVEQLSKITDLITCGIAATPRYVDESQGYPFLSSSNVKGGMVQWSDYKYIEACLHHQLYRNNPPKRGDVLYSRVGSIGEAAVIEVDFEFSIYVSLTLIKAKNSLSSYYLTHLLNSNPYKQRARNQVYLGGGVGNLNVEVVRKYPIPLPPTKAEQEAIAAALSDADDLIESLEQLIAKKRNIKQGAMQELLTGKRRLPGFSGEWEVKRLGSVMKFQVGFPFSSLFFNEEGQGVRLIKNRDLKNDDQVFHYSGSYAPEFVIQENDVLVGMDGDFLPCLWSKGPAILNQRVGRVVPFEGLNSVFSFYFLLDPLKEIENITSSTTVKHLSHGDVEGIERPLPSIEEQTAIAAILSDMDAELSTLESKLSKARQIKQGMMQELLTGRIRLV